MAARSDATASDADALAPEAPYAMDEKMVAMMRKAIASKALLARDAELLQRLVQRAVDIGWPKHSLALARLQALAAAKIFQSFAMGAACQASSANPLDISKVLSDVPSEGRRLLRAADDTILARINAGTLLRCTPSENSFCAAWDEVYDAAVDPSPTPHIIGYCTACMVAKLHIVALSEASLTNRASGAEDLDHRKLVVVRVLEVIEAVRGAPARQPTRDRSVLQLQRSDELLPEADLLWVMKSASQSGMLSTSLLAQVGAAWQKTAAAVRSRTRTFGAGGCKHDGSQCRAIN